MDNVDIRQQPNQERSQNLEKRLTEWDAKRRLNLQSGAVVLFANLVSIPDFVEGTSYDYTHFDTERNNLKKMAQNLMADSKSLNAVGGTGNMAKLVRLSYGKVAQGLIKIHEKAKSEQDQRSYFKDIARSIIVNDFNSLMSESGNRQLDKEWVSKLTKATSNKNRSDNSEVKDMILSFVEGDESIFEKQ